MKERTLVGGAVLLCLLFLAGCVSGNISRFDAGDFDKAQKIAVCDASGREKTVLTEKADINAFVEAMSVEDWRVARLPEGLTQLGSFTLWQEETATAFMEDDDMEFWEICTFRFYEDGDYLAIDIGLADIEITYTIPQDAADYLRNLLAQ